MLHSTDLINYESHSLSKRSLVDFFFAMQTLMLADEIRFFMWNYCWRVFAIFFIKMID